MPPADYRHSKADILATLRGLLAGRESPGEPPPPAAFSLGAPLLDAHLPRGGLTAGLHQILPFSWRDFPAAWGFLAALLSLVPQDALLLVVLARRGCADWGWPYGHGLRDIGLEPGRLLLVEGHDQAETLWALEEALGSRLPGAIAGTLGQATDLKTSQRLSVAARKAQRPLFLVEPWQKHQASAAATSWRIASAPGARDRFGLLGRPRWKVQLERCRNGRTGEWVVEWDHATHRFSLAAPLADPTLHEGTDLPAARRA